jgi:hypothetical protein
MVFPSTCSTLIDGWARLHMIRTCGSHLSCLLMNVTDLQGPPSERTQTEKIRDLKSLARQYTRDRGSCDDIRISYLEDLEDCDSDNLRLAQMLAM